MCATLTVLSHSRIPAGYGGSLRCDAPCAQGSRAGSIEVMGEKSRAYAHRAWHRFERVYRVYSIIVSVNNALNSKLFIHAIDTLR